MESVKVIARYINGKTLKGYTNNFSPLKPVFHIYPLEADTTSTGIKVVMRELKAVFFVKDFWGDSGYRESMEFTGKQQNAGRLVEVEFSDDEVMIGTTIGYDLKRLGFFLFPTDPKSNNLKVYVVSTAVREVLTDPACFTM